MNLRAARLPGRYASSLTTIASKLRSYRCVLLIQMLHANKNGTREVPGAVLLYRYG